MQTRSSQTDAPTARSTNGRDDHFISSITLPIMVVAESQIAAPRKTDAAKLQPKNRVPTV